MGTIEPKPRPDVLPGETERLKTGCEWLYVTINRDEHGIFDVFAKLGKSGGCAAAQSEAIGRLASLALRCGVPVELVIDQLAATRCPAPAFAPGGSILSCPDAIAKALRRNMERHGEAQPDGHEAPPLPMLEMPRLEGADHNPHEVSTVGGAAPPEATAADPQTFEPKRTVGVVPRLIGDVVKTAAPKKRKPKSVAESGLRPECPDCGTMLVYQEGCLRCPTCGRSRCDE